MKIDKIYLQLITELRHYFTKNGFSKSIIALSGGIDSAVVVALAVEALGKDNVTVLLLPSKYSSLHSIDDSVDMAERLEIEYHTISIEPIFDSAITQLSSLFGECKHCVAEENIQSRIRMLLTMAVANKREALMLNTSNKSEVMVGYGTLYGDTSGALGVIADLYKTEVYTLANYINEVQGNTIPQNIVDKAPSAELREGQYDTDSLPEYDVLDSILYNIDNGLSLDNFDKDTVFRVQHLCQRSEFKKRQLPPAIKITR